jgi:acyl-CoA reductase-like NAD-dependent aldehyde dehydrogenase
MADIQNAYIGGRFVKAEAGDSFATINPATEQEIGRITLCTATDVDLAVSAAREAFASGWNRTGATERASILKRVADGIRAHASELARIETADSGKPINDNLTGDVPEAAGCFDYFADLIHELKGETFDTPLDQFRVWSAREPVGVIGSIAPWNFPLVNAAWKIAPALAAGNCVVYKPAEDTPLSTLRLAQIIHDVGLPKGVVNIITGPGDPTGAALVGHPGIDALSFTGSPATGRSVLHAAADNITGCTLELGGKSANIVLNDCDLDRAVAGSLFAGLVNAGQVCTAGSRLLVHEAVYDAFMERFTRAAENIQIGDPTDEATRMGPLVSKRHLERVRTHIEKAVQDGATLRTGGRKPIRPAKGYYLMPTIFEDIPPGCALDQQEVFGPVVGVYRFRTDDQAVTLANATRYGLAAGVWSNDLKRAESMAGRLDAGTVWINTYNIVSVAVPFSGFKHSGIGSELGMRGLMEYTRCKGIYLDQSETAIDYFH